ncbi:hypothetical protein Y032_0014g2454 [Ancylostoma ceylanicum]|uniref:Uncharacterized protein n=1 Tax=Ancylostoma ceylanicum TaxID=53326 RepID=A0A016VC86_9BILA|nr:hypothetical protein Y032_0014g2454 [Ancylostoma ceylanicum]
MDLGVKESRRDQNEKCADRSLPQLRGSCRSCRDSATATHGIRPVREGLHLSLFFWHDDMCGYLFLRELFYNSIIV